MRPAPTLLVRVVLLVLMVGLVPGRLLVTACLMHRTPAGDAHAGHEGSGPGAPVAPCDCGATCQVPPALWMGAPEPPADVVVMVDGGADRLPSVPGHGRRQLRLPFATAPPARAA